MSDIDPQDSPLLPEESVEYTAAEAAAVEPTGAGLAFWTWGDAVTFVGLLFACLMAFAGILHLTFSGSPRIELIMLIAQFLAFGIASIGLAILLRVRYQARFWQSLNWRFNGWNIIPAFVSGVLLAFAVSAVNLLLNTKPVKTDIEALLRDPVAAPIFIFLGVTLAPLFEELFFRGFFQPLFIRTMGRVAGLLISGCLFALLHGPQYKWSWQYLLSLVLAGLTFALIRYRTGSTANSTLVHAGYNFTFFLAFLLLQKG